MPSGRCDRDRPLCHFLPAHVGEIDIGNGEQGRNSSILVGVSSKCNSPEKNPAAFHNLARYIGALRMGMAGIAIVPNRVV